uniref:JAB domain-containing protein n=1 Tax=Lacrimispora sp. TaxID=2719234 RepID=UPI00345FF475
MDNSLLAVRDINHKYIVVAEGEPMKKQTQEEKITEMMKRPIPKKKVGIVHLQMVKESRTLYGFKRFSSPQEAAEMLRPLLELSDREMFLIMSLNARLEPMAVEIVAVGGIDSCIVDIRNIFKHSILNNAVYVICFHNHLSGEPEPSREDKNITKKIQESGKLLGISLIDHIVIGNPDFYSFREHGLINFNNSNEAA